MKIYKFGGASVRNAEAIRNVAQIIRSAEEELLVVVSAMGKTTNALEQLLHTILNETKKQAQALWTNIVNEHQAVAHELGLDFKQIVPEDILASVPAHFNAQNAPYDDLYDSIVSVGELMSSAIVSAYLNATGENTMWWYIPDLLITDSTYREANVNNTASAQKVRTAWKNVYRTRVVVTQGFIGGDVTGHRTTLGREGSDYTAALLAAYLNAESVTIWKDVPGVLNADPRLCEQTVLIPELSYKDAVELAYSGAQIIHPKTIRPIANKQIPLYVRPFNAPTEKGSAILSNPEQPIDVPVYIWRENQVLVTMRAKDFSFVLEDSLTDIFEIICQCRLKVSLIQSSAITVSVCVDQSPRLTEAMERLRKNYSVNYNEQVALLTIRGVTPQIIEEQQRTHTVLLSQLTRRTAKFVVKK